MQGNELAPFNEVILKNLEVLPIRFLPCFTDRINPSCCFGVCFVDFDYIHIFLWSHYVVFIVINVNESSLMHNRRFYDVHRWRIAFWLCWWQMWTQKCLIYVDFVDVHLNHAYGLSAHFCDGKLRRTDHAVHGAPVSRPIGRRPGLFLACMWTQGIFFNIFIYIKAVRFVCNDRLYCPPACRNFCGLYWERSEGPGRILRGSRYCMSVTHVCY